jgi:hypothetical protein
LTAGWLLFGGLEDQNTWNTIPVSEQKNTLNNQTLNYRTNESKKRKIEQTTVKQ